MAADNLAKAFPSMRKIGANPSHNGTRTVSQRNMTSQLVVDDAFSK